jgi:hypothetical protein
MVPDTNSARPEYRNASCRYPPRASTRGVCVTVTVLTHAFAFPWCGKALLPVDHNPRWSLLLRTVQGRSGGVGVERLQPEPDVQFEPLEEVPGLGVLRVVTIWNRCVVPFTSSQLTSAFT